MHTADLVIGGDGQLGRMLTQAAHRLSLSVKVLGPELDSPAGQVAGADMVIQGDYRDAATVARAFNQSHHGTVEFEDVNTDGLKAARQAFAVIRPAPELLATIRDKYQQKVIASDLGIPLGAFAPVETPDEVEVFAAEHGYPVVLKKRFGSYDGYGNALVHNPDELQEAFARLSADSPLYVEAFVRYEHEVAVVLTRDKDGHIVVYPVTYTVQENHVCAMAIATRDTPISRAGPAAIRHAITMMNALDYVGTAAFEFFSVGGGAVRLCEMAPRVHNSGHWTIEGCSASQFDNHILAVMGRPLRPVEMLQPAAVMVNILGRCVRDLTSLPAGFKQVELPPGVHLHWYGKKASKPGRKLGHVTAVGDEVKAAKAAALGVRDQVLELLAS